MLHTSHTPTGAIMKMQEGQPKPQTVPLVLRSHGRNEIRDINTYVQPVIRCPAGIIAGHGRK